MKKITKVFVIFFLCFILGVFFIGLSKDPFYDTKSLEGQKIKNLKIDDSNKDNLISVNLLKKNNYTLLNFWASWCGPCRKEHPYLMKLSMENNLDLIGINFKDKKKNALDFLKELGNPYDEIADDKFGKQSVNFGIYGIPESILVDKNLIIIKKFIGPISENDYLNIKDLIKK